MAPTISDHYLGLDNSWNAGKIYCTNVTKNLLLARFPKIRESLIVPLTHRTTHRIRIRNERGQESFATVSVLKAKHCPGSAMYLFEGSFGIFLHTGDFRFDVKMYNYPTLQRVKGNVDRLFLDTTFCSPFWSFPTREHSLQQVMKVIAKHPPSLPVYIECEMLGQQAILIEIASQWNTKICVSRKTYRVLNSIPSIRKLDILTTDKTATRFFVCKHKTFTNDDSINASSSSSKGLFIKPSTQWFGQVGNGHNNPLYYYDKPCKANGVWHVLYSIHSSFSELKDFVRFIQPRSITPTTECQSSVLKEHFFPLLAPTKPETVPIHIKSILSTGSQNEEEESEKQEEEAEEVEEEGEEEEDTNKEEEQEKARIYEKEDIESEWEEKYRQKQLFLEILNDIELDISNQEAPPEFEIAKNKRQREEEKEKEKEEEEEEREDADSSPSKRIKTN